MKERRNHREKNREEEVRKRDEVDGDVNEYKERKGEKKEEGNEIRRELKR